MDNKLFVIGLCCAGLIDAAPVGPDDFSENTRELIAMRCLEELSASSSARAQAQGVNLVTYSSLDSRVRLDFSRTCEDVLQEILQQVKQFKFFNHL